MSDKPTENPQETSGLSVDLSSLSDTSFGPSWAGEKTEQKNRYKDYEADGPRRGGGKKRGGPGGRDRRAGGRPQRKGGPGGDFSGESSQGGDRSRFRRRDGGDERRGPRNRDSAPPFEPTVNVDIYPQDEAFDALVGRLTATARTYQLFEIARLILEKRERFIVVVSNKGKKEGKAVPLFFAVTGHLPFETEEAAVNHVLTNHLDHFFTIEAVELEAPKGNFQVVNRCGLTGELLGPPNYHRYQEFVQRHFNNRISNMSFERFQSKIETVKEQESIDAWMESMKKGERYILKERADGEPEALNTLEEVRLFLLQHRKDKVVSSSDSVRFAGRDIEHMPRGDLRRSVEMYCEQQKRFPLDTANNLRGRLRRHNFTVYKKGSKGASFVCSVKRKFRDETTVFSESIQGLINFIEANQEISAAKLPKEYLGIDAEKFSAAKAKPDAVEAEAPAEPEVEESAEPVSGDAPASVEAEVSSAEAAEAADPSGEAEEVASVEAEVKAEEASAGEAEPVEVEAVELSEEEKSRLSSLLTDLRWLVREGYVTEYGDGRLFAPPVQPKPKPKKKEVEASPEKAELPAEGAEAESPVEVPAEGESDAAAEVPVAEESPAVAEAEVLPEAEPAEPVQPVAEVAEAEPVLEPVAEEPAEEAEPTAEEAEAKEEAEAAEPEKEA